MSAESPPDGRRHEVLQAVREATEPVGIAHLAHRLQLHPNTIRFHLDRLVQQGRVRQLPPRKHGRGRPALLFTAAPGMDPAGRRDYRLLAGLLAGALLRAAGDPGAASHEAGRACGAQVPPPPGRGRLGRTRAVRGLQSLLEDFGFQPDDDFRDGSLALRHCPFLEVAELAPEAICPLHLGIMQGALEAWRAPVAVRDLQPFAEPDLCRVRLSARTNPSL